VKETFITGKPFQPGLYLQWPAGISEIEKVGDLKYQNLGIKNHLRNSGIEKSPIGSVKISPFRMKKFEINEPI